MSRKMIFLTLFSVFVLAMNSKAQNKTTLSTEEFEKKLTQKNIQLLDVRTQEEYNSGHIKNALLADWTNQFVFKERIQALDKTKPLYTYCLSGARSSAAASWLRANGFREVYHLEGGITSWKRNDRPVEGLKKVKPLTVGEYSAQIPADKTVLVDVGAVWCPPCKKMEPVLKNLQNSYGKLFKLIYVNGGEQESLAKQLGADAFPTFIIYKKGKEVWRRTGIVSEEELLKQLK